MEGDREMVERIRMSMRRIVSSFLAVFQLYFAVLYLFPSLTYPSTPSPTVRIVLFIQSLGPYFTMGFGISGGVLAVALLLRRFIYVGHLFCLMVFVSYTMALWLGAFTQQPHGSIIAPSLCLVPVVGHAALALSYGGERR